MIRMKKLIVILSMVIILFCLSGCGKISDKATTKKGTLILPQIGIGLEEKDTSKVQPAVKDENADYDLCGENEEILLSFKMSNSDKYASICLSNDQPEYIIYRFGLRDDIELEYADKTKSSWDNFTYSYYLRGGGPENEGLDLNYLYFENGGYTYQIYEEYSSDNDDTSVGILVTDLETGEEIDHKGDSDSIKGSLIGLRDNEKITVNMQ